MDRQKEPLTESLVRSLTHPLARSMMLSLHNLRGTVTGSRERMAVPSFLRVKNVEWPCSRNSDDGDEGKPMLREESRRVTRIPRFSPFQFSCV